jgi:hypothetical protein
MTTIIVLKKSLSQKYYQFLWLLMVRNRKVANIAKKNNLASMPSTIALQCKLKPKIFE